MKFPLIVFLIGAAISGSALGNRYDLTAQDAGRMVSLRCGDSLTIHLPANPSTGYLWSVTLSRPDILTPVGGGEILYPSHGSGERLLGAGGIQECTFRAIRSGNTKILYVYSRPWERGVAPARKIAWPVSVKE